MKLRIVVGRDACSEVVRMSENGVLPDFESLVGETSKVTWISGN